MLRIAKRLVVLATTALVMAGCGGGGGSSDSIDVTFDQTSLSVSAFEGQELNLNASEAASTTVVATVRNLPSNDLFVRIVDSGEGFNTSLVEIVRTSNDQYTATLSPNAALQAGTYKGTLKLDFCADSTCSKQYSARGASLAYTVTITPQLSVVVKAQDAVVTTINSDLVGSFAIELPPGGTVELESNIPVKWLYATDFIITVDPSSTSKKWKAVLTLPQFPMLDYVELVGFSQDSSKLIQNAISVHVTLTQ
jgi:predicted component of type VI protein secretion system